jgi:hypothetical protein
MACMSEETADALLGVAREIIARAEQQHRDLSDFEAGRVDALVDIAGIIRAQALEKARHVG